VRVSEEGNISESLQEKKESRIKEKAKGHKEQVGCNNNTKETKICLIIRNK